MAPPPPPHSHTHVVSSVFLAFSSRTLALTAHGSREYGLGMRANSLCMRILRVRLLTQIPHPPSPTLSFALALQPTSIKSTETRFRVAQTSTRVGSGPCDGSCGHWWRGSPALCCSRHQLPVRASDTGPRCCSLSPFLAHGTTAAYLVRMLHLDWLYRSMPHLSPCPRRGRCACGSHRRCRQSRHRGPWWCVDGLVPGVRVPLRRGASCFYRMHSLTLSIEAPHCLFIAWGTPRPCGCFPFLSCSCPAHPVA